MSTHCVETQGKLLQESFVLFFNSGLSNTGTHVMIFMSMMNEGIQIQGSENKPINVLVRLMLSTLNEIWGS